MNLTKILITNIVIVIFASACSSTPATPSATGSVSTSTQEITTRASITPEKTATNMVIPTQTPLPTPTITPRPTPIPTLTPTPTLQPTPIPTLPPLPQAIGSNTCPGTQPSILMPNHKGRVSNASSDSIRVRVEAGFQAKQVGLLPPGEFFNVIGGPQCVDGVAWFHVEAENGVQGWMAEGSPEEYWVQPIVSDARDVSGQTIALQELIFTLPEEIGSKMRIADIPYNPETKTPPYSLARLAEYPLPDVDSAIYVYSVEEYLYYRSDRQGDLEQVRGSINSLMKNPEKEIHLISLTDSLVIGEAHLVQAGSFSFGFGYHAIAMVGPSDGSRSPKPYYVFYGFSSDMKYFVFAKLDVQLTFGQWSEATTNDFKPSILLLDQVFGLSIGSKISQGTGAITACPGAPAILLKINDWARVNVDPPSPSRIRSQPGGSGEIIGQVQPGENVLVVDGPQCANGYTWWFVRSLDGLEGWAAEGDANGYWLFEPISVWYQLPEPLVALGTKTYDLREMRISPDKALVSGISGNYLPLATPLPTPQTAETPWPDDPRGSLNMGYTASYAAQSGYGISGAIGGNITVYDLQDPLSRYYINRMSYDDCTQALRKNLESGEIVAAYLDPFCGSNGAIPLHFIVDVKPIQFSGGKGVRFLISSANWLTVNKMEYIFQGLSDDGRYFIRGRIPDIAHPYIVDQQLWENDFGPLLAWKEGQYEEAGKSYQVFNARMEKLLNAGVVPLYPALELLDAMMASIVIK
jgi:hypothetical protein